MFITNRPSSGGAHCSLVLFPWFIPHPPAFWGWWDRVTHMVFQPDSDWSSGWPPVLSLPPGSNADFCMSYWLLVTITSYNVRGLNVAAKCHQVIRELKHAACSIAFLQETHLTHTTLVRLTSSYFPQWYYSLSDTNKAKGVAIGFSSGGSFRLIDMLADDFGHFLFLKGFIGNTQCTFANI